MFAQNTSGAKAGISSQKKARRSPGLSQKYYLKKSLISPNKHILSIRTLTGHYFFVICLLDCISSNFQNQSLLYIPKDLSRCNVTSDSGRRLT